MSKTVDEYTGSLTSEEEDPTFAEGSPEVIILDKSSLAGNLAGELEQISWDHRFVETEEEALAHTKAGDGDCLVVDPSIPDDVSSFILDLRRQTDIPVVVWGNDLESDAIRQIASILNADYVPKPTEESQKIFCMSSLDEVPQHGPIDFGSSSDGPESDETVVSIIYHAVRAYWMGERVETQLDAIENSINGIAILDEEYEFIYANETLADLLGYDSTEILIGNSAQMCFPHHEIDRFREKIIAHAESEGDWRGGVDCRRMDGSIFPSRVSVSWLDAGKYILTIEDVSEQQVLQEELEEFHEHIGQAFIAVGDDLRISHVNQTARAYFELPQEESIIGETLFEIHFTEIESELRDGFAEVDMNDEETSISLRLDSLGSWLETRIYPFDQGYALYFRDITEEKEQQRQLDLAKNFIDQSTDAYFVIEVESTEIVDINPTAHRWLGVSEDNLIGMSIVDLINKFSDINDYTVEEHLEFCSEARGDGVAVHSAQYGPPAGTMYPVKAQGTCEVVNGTEYLIVAGQNTNHQVHDPDEDATQSIAQSFLESDPDPSILLKPDTNEIIEANYRMVEFGEYSYDDLVGSHYRRLFPNEIADCQMELYQEVLEAGGGRFRRCENGSYVRIRTQSGDEVPVEISTSTIELSHQTAHLVVIRPIEDDVQYEQSFKQVNEMTHDLVIEDSPNEIAKTAVDAIGDMPVFAGSGLYLYDDSEGVLEAAAYNEPEAGAIDGTSSFEPGDGGLWEVYSEDETRVFDCDDSIAPCSSSHGGVAVPVGSHGVLFVCCTEQTTHGDITVNIAKVIGSSIESALNRARSVKELKDRKRRANIQKQQLEYVSELNKQIRSLNKALVQAESEEAIKNAVCDELIGLDDFDGILLSDIDCGGRVGPSESIEVPDEFLEHLPLSRDVEAKPPTVRAVQDQEVVEVSNIASRAKQDDWATTALEYEYKSAISIPLEYGDISYGVLTIYSELSESFDGRTKSVLEELGSLVAYAFHAVTSRAALGSNSGIDLSFTIGEDSGLSVLAEALDATVTVQNITPANDDDYYLVHGHIEDAAHETVVDAVNDIPVFDDLRVIGEPESGIYELKVEEPGNIIKIVNLGVSLQSAVVTPKNIEIIVTLPANRDRGQFIDQVKNHLPTTELRASQEEIDTNTIPWTRMLRGSLTEKQETALRTAYYVGYFDSPAKTNGRELADRLGLSQGTISYRLRAAQRNLYETLWHNNQKQPIKGRSPETE